MRPFDTNRLREAARGPGADTRVWLELARVEEDENAIRLDPELGLLVDVTILGGPLDQEGPIPCRVASAFVEPDGILSHPLDRSAVYVVSIPSGDLNEQPTLVGRLYAAETRPPSSVNGEALAELVDVAHVLRSSARGEVELDGDLRVRAANVRALGQTVELAEEGASRSFVRGEDLRDAIDAFAMDVLSAAASLVPPGPPATPVTGAEVATFLVDLGVAVATLQAAAGGYLSTRIRGE